MSLADLSLGNTITYGVVQPGADDPHGVPMIRVNNFTANGLDLSNLAHITPSIEAKYTRTRLHPHDVLITVVGSVGQVAIVPAEAANWNIARAVALIRPADMKLSRWIALCLRSPFSQHSLNVTANTTVQTTVNLKELKQLAIPMPPTREREEIAATLSALDDRIELLRQTNATLEAIAQTLFRSWFIDFDPVRAKAEGRWPNGMDAATAELLPDSFEDSPLGPIPQGWRVDEIGNVVNCIGGATPSTKEPSFWEPAEHHWVTPKDLSGLAAPVLMDTSRKISTAGLKRISSGTLPKGTLLLSSRAPIGYLAITQIPTAINQGFIAMPLGGELPPTYLLFWARWNLDSIKQVANGSTFMEISKSAFRPIKLCVPSKKIVKAFASIAEPLLERIAANEAQRTQLAQLRDTLLPRLISGKLRLPEAQTLIEEATP